MWWNGRFTSRMCSRQKCSNCMMLSCQYGPKSLRNVSNTLLNICHNELRQFWRQKWVQPGTSKVYLIKWPVIVDIWFCSCWFALQMILLFKFLLPQVWTYSPHVEDMRYVAMKSANHSRGHLLPLLYEVMPIEIECFTESENEVGQW